MKNHVVAHEYLNVNYYSTFCSKKVHRTFTLHDLLRNELGAARNNLFLRIKRCKRARRVHCAERTRSSRFGGITFIYRVVSRRDSTCVHRRHGRQAGCKYLQRAPTNRSFMLERGSGYPFVGQWPRWGEENRKIGAKIDDAIVSAHRRQYRLVEFIR